MVHAYPDQKGKEADLDRPSVLLGGLEIKWTYTEVRKQINYGKPWKCSGVFAQSLLATTPEKDIRQKIIEARDALDRIAKYLDLTKVASWRSLEANKGLFFKIRTCL